MKIEVDTVENFKPFTFSVTFETKEEAIGLWHYLNTPKTVVKLESRGRWDGAGYDAFLIWKVLDAAFENRGIDPQTRKD